MLSINSPTSSLLLNVYQNNANSLPSNREPSNSERLTKTESKSLSENKQGITLNISPNSLEKLAQEQMKESKKIAQDITEKFRNTRTKTTEQNNQDPIDALLKQLKEQIKDIKEKLQATRYDDSDAAERQRKALNAQLITLTSLLLSTMGKKLESV